ncbi:MAG: helix-turn-helix transcriptional regulator [Mycobacteriales bacterium]
MSAAAARLERLLSLVPWLRTHPGASMAAAAAAFGTSEKAIGADIDLLFCCGLPGGGPGDLIDFAFEGDAVTVLDAQLLDRPLTLDGDEALALLVAVRALADVVGLSERDALERVAAKLEAAVGSGPQVTVVPAEADPTTLALVREGQQQRRQLHLAYLAAARDEVTERDVDPMRVLMREGNWYLEAYCHRAEAVRLFRVDRIDTVRVLDTPAAPPPDAAVRDDSAGLFLASPDQLLVELELEPSAAWVADYYPCEQVGEEPGGRLRIGLRTSDPHWVRSLVMRLGGGARVLAPPDLADDVRIWAEEALAAYAD